MARIRPAETTGGFVLGCCAVAGIAATVLATIRPGAGAAAHGAALLCASLAPALFTGFGYLAVPRCLGAATSAVPGLALAVCCSVAAAAAAAIASCDGATAFLAPMAAFAWLGLACAALDLVSTILIGRDRRIRLGTLSPLPTALLACGLMLVMVLPIQAGIATRLVLFNPAGPGSGTFVRAMVAPAMPLLLALGLGVVAEVAGVRSSRVRAAIVAEAALGCLVWSHLVLDAAAWPLQGEWRAAWFAAIAAPAMVPIVPILNGVVRTLRSDRRGAAAVAHWHAASFGLLVPIGLLQLAAGQADGHGALSLACLFAVFCGFCAWSEPLPGRLGAWRDRGLGLQFAMIAVGTVLMLAGPAIPLAASCGETVAALASVWFASTVIVGSVRLGRATKPVARADGARA